MCDMSMVEVLMAVFFFKQKTAYEMRISDWSSDVCSSDLRGGDGDHRAAENRAGGKGGAQNKGRRNRPAPFALPFREGSPYFVCVSPTPLSDGAISPLSSIALAFSSPISSTTSALFSMASCAGPSGIASA